jgi:hypothetical protein
MRKPGSSLPAGFQLTSGMIGSTATLAINNTMCRVACTRGASLRVVKSE